MKGPVFLMPESAAADLVFPAFHSYHKVVAIVDMKGISQGDMIWQMVSRFFTRS